MKKKAILGFMTGAAIVAATTGSYAAWDSLTLKQTGSTTINGLKPITLTATSDTIITPTMENRDLNANPVIITDIPVTVTNASSTSKDLTLTTTPAATIDGTDVNGSSTVEIFDDKNVQVDLSATPITDGNYIIKVTTTLNDDDKTHVTNGVVSVTVDAALEEKSK